MAARGGEKDEPMVIDSFPGLDGHVEWDVRPISRKGSERVIRFAFELSKGREEMLGVQQSVTCVDKSNVTRGCRLFREVFREVSSEYPSMKSNEAYIDAFTMWFAGGGTKAGHIVGETDELGFDAISDPAHTHDIHATILHLLGLDHERLTFRFQGRDFRLTDVHGQLIHKLYA